MLLNEKVVLITGASKGVGKTSAIAYAQQGAKVILLSRSIKLLEKLQLEISETYQVECCIYPLNLANATPDDYIALREAIKKRYGKLDILVHAATAKINLTPLEHTDPKDWMNIIQTNLNGPMFLTQALIPIMKLKYNSYIIFFKHPTHDKAKAFWGAYSAAGAASLNIQSLLKQELENTCNIKIKQISIEDKLDTHFSRNVYAGLSKSELRPTSLVIGKLIEAVT